MLGYLLSVYDVVVRFTDVALAVSLTDMLCVANPGLELDKFLTVVSKCLVIAVVSDETGTDFSMPNLTTMLNSM